MEFVAVCWLVVDIGACHSGTLCSEKQRLSTWLDVAYWKLAVVVVVGLLSVITTLEVFLPYTIDVRNTCVCVCVSLYIRQFLLVPISGLLLDHKRHSFNKQDTSTGRRTLRLHMAALCVWHNHRPASNSTRAWTTGLSHSRNN